MLPYPQYLTYGIPLHWTIRFAKQELSPHLGLFKTLLPLLLLCNFAVPFMEWPMYRLAVLSGY
jgi:hypothetical protein